MLLSLDSGGSVSGWWTISKCKWRLVSRAVGGKTPGFPGFALLASERRLREEGERGGREGGGVLGLNPTPSRSTRLDRIENFPINFFPKK